MDLDVTITEFTLYSLLNSQLHYVYLLILNKTALRALGRSPEEKVKDHSGAIYRGPLI